MNFHQQSWVKLLRQLTMGVVLTISLALLILCLDIQPVFAASPLPPLTCRLGVYLLSLQDFDVSAKEFSADFWIWINCPTESPEVLQRIDFLNSKEMNVSLDSEQKRDNIYWATHKVQGIFKHNWEIGNFPFDRHVLTIEMEHGLLDRTQLVYTPDSENSNYQQSLKVDGWKVTNFKLQEYTKDYNTTYGDPALKPGDVSSFSHIDVAIDIQRSSIIVFLKLTTAVYVAVGISLVIYLVPEFEARMGTLIGALFAIVINQQVVDSVLGQTDGIKLVDQIHITAMLYVLSAVIFTIISYWDSKKENEQTLIRRDRLSFSISMISFIVVNIILISHAAIVG